MASTKSFHFKRSYLRQNWSIPDSIIYSFTTNPSSAKAWQKLIQSCKYFFGTNKILVIHDLDHEGNEKWKAHLLNVVNGEKARFIKSADFTKIVYKIWLTDGFFKTYYMESRCPLNLVSSIIPYFYRCDIKMSQLCNQEIPYDQFKFIFSKVEVFYSYYCVVRNMNDEIVPLEKLVQAFPKLKRLKFLDNLTSSSVTSNTVKELLKIPHISKIDDVFLWGLPEKFDLETFYIYFKKDKHTKFRIHFRDAISEAYKIHIEAIVDDIIATTNHDYKIPFIHFADLTYEKWGKIESLIYQQNKQ